MSNPKPPPEMHLTNKPPQREESRPLHINYLLIFLFLIGLAIIIYGIWYINNKYPQDRLSKINLNRGATPASCDYPQCSAPVTDSKGNVTGVKCVAAPTNQNCEVGKWGNGTSLQPLTPATSLSPF